MNLEERVMELETKMTFLENYVNELNDVIIQQGKSITSLSLDAENLKKQLLSLRESMPEGERPPHY